VSQPIEGPMPESPEEHDSVSSRRQGWPDYATVWRWHFYAGLFCIPFVIVLSITGTIYLFRPQIEAFQERGYDRLPVTNTMAQPYAEQIRAAVQNVPDSRFAALELPAADSSATRSADQTVATRVIVDQAGRRVRVYVDPNDASVLGAVVENERFIRVVRRIHGELLLGKRGSYLVELAASWTIVMVVTGMVLWLPRKLRAAGVLYPRLFQRGKTFWKDLHSVGGFWASGLIVFLIATGLPWSTFWGDYFKSVRRVTGTAVIQQHWDGGHGKKSEQVLPSTGSGHEGHAGHEGHDQALQSSKQGLPPAGPAWRTPVPDPTSYDVEQIAGVAQVATTLDFMPPIVVSPPTAGDAVWTIKSETANRPYQQTVRLDAETGKTISHERFADRHWVDRWVGQGIALHEGQRFGLANQLIALFATVSLVMLSCTGLLLWWRRRQAFKRSRDEAAIGWLPPPRRGAADQATTIVPSGRLWMAAVLTVALAIYLPIFALSLSIVLILDRFVLSRWRGLSARGPTDVAAG